MTPEDVLSHPPRALSQARREFYFENGYLAVERFVSFSTPTRPPTPFPMRRIPIGRGTPAGWCAGSPPAGRTTTRTPASFPRAGPAATLPYSLPGRERTRRVGVGIHGENHAETIRIVPGAGHTAPGLRSRRAARAELRDRSARDADCRLYRAGTGVADLDDMFPIFVARASRCPRFHASAENR